MKALLSSTCECGCQGAAALRRSRRRRGSGGHAPQAPLTQLLAVPPLNRRAHWIPEPRALARARDGPRSVLGTGADEAVNHEYELAALRVCRLPKLALSAGPGSLRGSRSTSSPRHASTSTSVESVLENTVAGCRRSLLGRTDGVSCGRGAELYRGRAPAERKSDGCLCSRTPSSSASRPA